MSLARIRSLEKKLKPKSKDYIIVRFSCDGTTATINGIPCLMPVATKQDITVIRDYGVVTGLQAIAPAPPEPPTSETPEPVPPKTEPVQQWQPEPAITFAMPPCQIDTPRAPTAAEQALYEAAAKERQIRKPETRR